MTTNLRNPIGRHAADTDPGADWRHRAACRETDPEAFFPVSTAEDASEPAIRICRACPVVEECLRWALDRGEDAGVWGGTSPRTRRALRRRFGLTPRPTRVCLWCAGPLEPGVSASEGYCSPRCREAGARARLAKRQTKQGER